jgi:predicted RNA binding protein YcfA (HicA-like mRNA interferase family)
MPKLPRVTAKQIIAVLEKKGFLLARQSGSHMIYKNSLGSASLFLSMRRRRSIRSF